MVVDLLDQHKEYALHVHQFVLWPLRWQECQEMDTFEWEIQPLRNEQRPEIPNEPGIYTLLVQPGIVNHPCSYLMYLGQTTSLRRRFGEYLSKERREDGRPKIFRVLNSYPDHTWFCFSRISTTRLDAVEDALLAAYIPPANDQLPAEISRVKRAF